MDENNRPIEGEEKQNRGNVSQNTPEKQNHAKQRNRSKNFCSPIKLNPDIDYTKTRNYWKYLKSKLKKAGDQLVSATTQLKLIAADGKKYKSDMLDYAGIIELGKSFPGTKANRYIEWFTYSDESIDGKSKTKAYALFDSSFITHIEVGTTRGLQ